MLGCFRCVTALNFGLVQAAHVSPQDRNVGMLVPLGCGFLGNHGQFFCGQACRDALVFYFAYIYVHGTHSASLSLIYQVDPVVSGELYVQNRSLRVSANHMGRILRASGCSFDSWSVSDASLFAMPERTPRSFVDCRHTHRGCCTDDDRIWQHASRVCAVQHHNSRGVGLHQCWL